MPRPWWSVEPAGCGGSTRQTPTSFAATTGHRAPCSRWRPRAGRSTRLPTAGWRPATSAARCASPARTAEEVSIAGWPDPVAHLAWLADGRRVVVVGGDEATVWSVEPPDDDEREPPRAATPRGPISALAAHPWLPLVALGSEAGDVVWWDVDAERTIDALDVGSPVTAIAWDGLGERTHIATRAGRIWSRPVG